MKKKFFVIAGCIIICLLPIFFVWLGAILLAVVDDDYKVTDGHGAVEFDFKKLWGMQFPEGFTPDYIFYNRYCAFGTGFFYAVYECEDYNDVFLTEFSSEYNGQAENSIKKCFDDFYTNIETYNAPYKVLLDRSYIPDFNSNFTSINYHKDSDENLVIGENNYGDYSCHLYLAYFFDTKTLYIYENII